MLFLMHFFVILQRSWPLRHSRWESRSCFLWLILALMTAFSKSILSRVKVTSSSSAFKLADSCWRFSFLSFRFSTVFFAEARFEAPLHGSHFLPRKCITAQIGGVEVPATPSFSLLETH